MAKTMHPAMKFGIPIIIVIVLLIAGYFVVESKIFSALENQPGVNIEIGSRSGSLFSGYTLKNVAITQRQHRDAPPGRLATPRLKISWAFSPFRIEGIEWDEATYTILDDGASIDPIPVSAGQLAPDGSGWLVLDDEIVIGPDEWNGDFNFKIRADVERIEGKITIENLPGSMIEIMGDIPPGFQVPSRAHLVINLDGSPKNMRATGTVSDTYTRRSFNF